MNFLVQSRKTNPDPPCPQIRHVLSVGLGAISCGIAANRGNFILAHPVLVPEPPGRSQPLVLHKQEEESYRGGGDLLFTVCLSLKRYCQIFFPCYCTEFEKLERTTCSQGQLQQFFRTQRAARKRMKWRCPLLWHSREKTQPIKLAILPVPVGLCPSVALFSHLALLWRLLLLMSLLSDRFEL